MGYGGIRGFRLGSVSRTEESKGGSRKGNGGSFRGVGRMGGGVGGEEVSGALEGAPVAGLRFF